MPITIAKTAGAGASSDTTLTIRNIETLIGSYDSKVDRIPNILGTEEQALLLAFLGSESKFTISWTIMVESSSVVSGAGGTVTTATHQVQYLHTWFVSKGPDGPFDSYQLVILFDSTPLNTGTASSGTSTTLVDTGIGWSSNAYAGKLLHLTGGTGSGQYRTIVSNTTDTATVDRAWDTNPNGTTTYEILDAIGRQGRVTNVSTALTGERPLTFKATIEFEVGDTV